MRRPTADLGNSIRALAVVVVALTLAEIGPTTGNATPRPRLDPRAAYAPNPERVALQVDGWVIEVDAVAAAVVPTGRSAARPPVVVSSVPRPAAVLSRYDDLIHWHASSHGLDWRLVTALIQEESGFRESAVSSKGAIGLMQVRPIAAEDVGETAYSAPSDNIRTGIRYLKRLDSMLAPSAVGRDRLALVLAAYNMGPAHLQDAQMLARTFGYDPHRWENAMALMLPLLEDERFHRRVPSGYAQGARTVTYVERILNRYDRFRVEAGEAPGLARPAPQAASATG